MGDRMEKGIKGLYRFKNKKGEIIYIGKADDLHTRLHQHGHLPLECYEEINSIEYSRIDNSTDRDILELVFITNIKPKYNKQLKYSEPPTILKEKDYNLYWNKVIDLSEFDFKLQHERYQKIKCSQNPNGRPKIDMTMTWEEIDKLREQGTSITELCNMMNISKSTFLRRQRERKIEEELYE